MSSRRRLARTAWVACALLVLPPLFAQQAPSPVDDGIDAALDEVLRLREEPRPDADLLLRATEELRRRLRTRQDAVLVRELEFVASADARRSMRAQLLLAQVPRLPEETRSRLLNRESLSAQAYAALRAPPRQEPERRATDGTMDADTLHLLDAVAAEIHTGLSIRVEELEVEKPEFAADYLRECAPRLSRPQEFVRADQCLWVDLDGDGTRELVVVCDSVWETFWLHDLAFVGVIHAATRRLRLWRLPVGGRVRSVRALDLDGDGSPEIVVVLEVMGGRAVGSAVLVVSSEGVTSLPVVGASSGIRLLGLGDVQLVVARSGPDWQFPDGAAKELCGALAARHDVYRFRAGVLEKLTSVWLPLTHGDD
ncbi:MAG: VCBS repeat-containing protein [Planctomycetes bacterium]|nr:VCBS repeat-containing protein [Planctomycetota bacterium]